MKGATIEEFWAEFNQDELKESADYILRLIEKEAEHLNNDTTKIFLGGVSQGCMVSLAAFLRYNGPQRLGGIIGLNGMQGLSSQHMIHSLMTEEEKQRILEMQK